MTAKELPDKDSYLCQLQSSHSAYADLALQQ